MTGGQEAPRVGNGMPLAPVAPCNVYLCKPGGANDYVYIYTSRWPGSPQWRRLLQTIGRDDLLDEPRFATPELRYEHRTEVDAVISAWTGERTKEEAMVILGSAGVPAGAVFSTSDLSNDPYLRERGAMVEIEHPTRGRLVMPGNSIRLTDSHVPIQPAPLLGQHNREVYTGLRGLSNAFRPARQSQRGTSDHHQLPPHWKHRKTCGFPRRLAVFCAVSVAVKWMAPSCHTATSGVM